ncbi:MAG: FtsW/RodA/SpoVE family cell cycle protein [Acidimicrobiia bacterium]
MNRRNTELGLGLLAVLIAIGGYILVELAKQTRSEERIALPADLWLFFALVIGLFLIAHLAVRKFAPDADPTFLPLAVMLNGLGFVMISRLDSDRARIQALWTALGIACFIAVLLLVRRTRVLERYKYTFAFAGIVALLLPLAPGIGAEINGARLWLRLGPLSFQPGEIAKVLLVLFFAGYLVEKRELLARGSLHIGRLALPDPKHLGPLLLAWAVSILVMVRQKDLGSSLLFFTVFATMLYIATNRSWYLGVAALLFGSGATIAYQLFGHVQTRVSTWIDPWPTAQSSGYQLTQSLFAFGSGGVFGTGLGLGRPGVIPNAPTDFVFAAIGEELGLIGAIAVVCCYLLLCGSGYRTALRTARSFEKLLAAGLTTIIGVQTFVILGGVTRVIPLTGITMPFVSYGGSSLVANWIIIALLVRISDEHRREERSVLRDAASVSVPA